MNPRHYYNTHTPCTCPMIVSLQMERCITLLKTNPEASRRFYQLAVCHLSVGDVAKFIQTILSTLVQCVEGGEGGATSEDASSDDEEKLEGDSHTHYVTVESRP